MSIVITQAVWNMISLDFLFNLICSILLRYPQFFNQLVKLVPLVSELRRPFLYRVYPNQCTSISFILKENLCKLTCQRLDRSSAYLQNSETVLSNPIFFEKLLHSVKLVSSFSFYPIKVIPHVYVRPQDTATLLALGDPFG